MQRVNKEIELAQWFSALLQDPSLQRLHDMRTGAHLVQVVHSMNPSAFDLSRCDFLASTPYHFEKNFKLLQAVMPPPVMPQSIVIERLMEGDKQRDLFQFCSYIKLHYEAWKMQVADLAGASPTRHAITNSEPGGSGVAVFLPQKHTPNNISSNASSSIRELQAAYDPVMERATAKARRKGRSRPLLVNGAFSDSQSQRSGSDTASFGVRSSFSYTPFRSAVSVGGIDRNRRSSVSFQAAPSTDPPPALNIENWAEQVQSPTRSTTESGSNSPLAPQDINLNGAASNAPANACLQGQPSSRHEMNFQHHDCVAALRLWDLIPNPSANAERHPFLVALRNANLSSIVDVEGENIASTRFLSFEDLVRQQAVTEGEDPWSDFDKLMSDVIRTVKPSHS